MEIWRFGSGPNDHKSEFIPGSKPPKKGMKRRSVTLNDSVRAEAGPSVVPPESHLADVDVDMNVDHEGEVEGEENTVIELEHPRNEPDPEDADPDEGEEADEIVVHAL